MPSALIPTALASYFYCERYPSHAGDDRDDDHGGDDDNGGDDDDNDYFGSDDEEPLTKRVFTGQ